MLELLEAAVSSRLVVDALVSLQRDAIRALLLRAGGSPLYAGALALALSLAAIVLSRHVGSYLRAHFARARTAEPDRRHRAARAHHLVASATSAAAIALAALAVSQRRAAASMSVAATRSGHPPLLVIRLPPALLDAASRLRRRPTAAQPLIRIKWPPARSHRASSPRRDDGAGGSP